MFVIILRYTKPLAEIDRLMPAHVRFLEEGYAAGVFLASGRRVPRDGGVIIAAGAGVGVVSELMAHDPFVEAGAATFEVIEFRTSFHHPALTPFADPGTRTMKNVPHGPSKR